MTRKEHLLVIGMEECNEVAQRLSKALRFGLSQVQAEADHSVAFSAEESLTNVERIRKEFSDLAAVLEMLGIGAPLGRWMDEKRAKVEHFLQYSEQCGTLSGDLVPTPQASLNHGGEPLHTDERIPESGILIANVRLGKFHHHHVEGPSELHLYHDLIHAIEKAVSNSIDRVTRRHKP